MGRAGLWGLGFPIVLAACQDHELGTFNTAPSVSILSPADRAELAAGDLVELRGVALDSQTDAVDLGVIWSSSLDGELGVNPPDAEGNVYATANALSPGEHAITLTAVDTDGTSASATIAVTVGFGNESEGSPTVILVGPTDGESFTLGAEVNFVGTLADDEQAWESLASSLVSDKAGNLWVGNPETNGTVTVPWIAEFEGDHVVTLYGEDQDGHVASDSITITVKPDDRPVATILAPAAGSTFLTTDTITLEGQVSDSETDTEQLAVTWTSDLQGTLTVTAPDSSGYTVFATPLVEGTHAVTLHVVDGDAKDASDTIAVNVKDPLNSDDDGDGWTENTGDCDDADGTTHPDAAEVCDHADNDCDGFENEDYWDAYEENDTTATVSSLGEVDDGILWISDALSVAGLTFHTETDQDHFTWAADDEWYDNVNIHVQAGPFSVGSDVVLELYMDDGGGWSLVDSASGNGFLHAYYEGDLFETDEDDFLIKVYPSTWTGTCTDTYDIEIDS